MGNRRVFITFLGISTYSMCNYILDTKHKVTKVQFVQEALVRLLCRDYCETDRIFVFLTKEARSKNWPVLIERLGQTGIEAGIEGVSIPDGSSEEGLWQIFSIVVKQFERGDRVIFDITHGFRSLPMLCMVLLQYARMMKEIEIEGIYYGAFDARDGSNNAPIFDLTSFATLLEWTSAVQEFVRHGNPTGIAELLFSEAKVRLATSKGNDDEAKIWRDIGKSLDSIGWQITTCRGAEIVKGKSFANIGQRLGGCEEPDVPPLFRPLLDRIKEKTGSFAHDDVENCLEAVRWCITHGLVQQGLTMLQEGIITILAEMFGLDWGKLKDRELISGAIHVKNKNSSLDKWDNALQERVGLVKRIHADALVEKLAPIFDQLSKARNDINHGGVLTEVDKRARGAEKLSKTLADSFRDVENILGDVAERDLPENTEDSGERALNGRGRSK